MRRVFTLAFLAALVVAFFAVPALPGDKLGPLAQFKKDTGEDYRRLSISQRWGMYAPDPQRSQSYPALTAVYADGSKRRLPEYQIAKSGFDTSWAWDKDRNAIWRHHIISKAKKRNRNRTWYLRGICVREARSGEAPTRIVMERFRKRFRHPDKVREGKKPLRGSKRLLVETVRCDSQVVKKMIAADQAWEEGG